jgi:hypothetical protein
VIAMDGASQLWLKILVLLVMWPVAAVIRLLSRKMVGPCGRLAVGITVRYSF